VPRGDKPVNATRHQVTVGGHAVYAAYFEGGQGYRIDKTSGIATGNEPETLYMVTSGKHYNGGCCFGSWSGRRLHCLWCARNRRFVGFRELSPPPRPFSGTPPLATADYGKCVTTPIAPRLAAGGSGCVRRTCDARAGRVGS
jgi:hypothetical protein